MGSFSIKVKAQDIHFDESSWSDPLPVSMPKLKLIQNATLLRLLTRLAEIFPFFEKISGL